MLKLLVFVSISAKLMAFAWASEQEVACTKQTTISTYNDILVPLLRTIYPGIDDETIDGVARFYAANDGVMGMCLYNQICTTGKNDNIISSTYPFLFQSSQLASCADESMRKEILNTMNLNSMLETDKMMPFETNYFRIDVPKNYSSTIDYLIMADNKHQFTDDFNNRYASLIRGETQTKDYGDFCSTADYFNDWMKLDGCSLDHDFLNPERPVDDSGLIMGSKNHFTVYWDKSCKPLKTVSIDFCESDGNVVTTDALYFEGYAKYNYDENLKAQVIEIPLAGDYKLRILSPDDYTKMEETLFRLRTPCTYRNTFVDELKDKSTFLKLTIPISTETCGSEDYVTGLKMVNMYTDAFHPKANVFSSGFEDSTGVYLAHMFHNILLTIGDVQDEEETDSAACEDSNTSGKTVLVDKPYIFEIICFANTRMLAGVKQVAN